MVEEACTRLLPREAEELRAESSQLLRNNCPPKPNLTLEECRAIKELKDDHSQVVLTVEEGVAMVGMDKEDYADKPLSLIVDANTYNIITKDPTTKLKKINLPRHSGTLKTKEESMITVTGKCIPLVQFPKNVMAFPKDTKFTPLSPIVPSRGSIKYSVAKKLPNIICPLVGQSPCHVKNTQHFVQHIRKVKLEPGEVITSYDVKAFFTSVPMEPSINIVKQKLHQDPTLSQRTNMSIQQIVTLLEFCLKNTYFPLQGKYYEQTHGASMGSSH